MGDDAEIDAGAAAVTALRVIAARIRELHPAALADEPDAVHQLRTQVRRLRSLLVVFAPLFDGPAAAGLQRRFAAFGDELGTVRDLEVRVQVAERALETMAAERADVGGDAAEQLDLARERLVGAGRAEYRLAHGSFADRQSLPRAVERLAELDRFLTAPPLTPQASEPARRVLGDLVSTEARRTGRWAERVEGSSDVEVLHGLRKAGRRLRYAAESVTTDPVDLLDGRVPELARVGDELHDLLGDHRDQVVFAEYVRRTAAHAAHEGGPSLAFEQLAREADSRAAVYLGELPRVIGALRSLIDS